MVCTWLLTKYEPYKCPGTQEHTRVEIIPRHVDLLFSLSSQSLHSASHSQCTTAAWTALEMVYEAESSLHCIEMATAFIKGTHTLWRASWFETRMWHLSIWGWSYGLPCTLPNSTERPNGFASWTLSNAERKYSQIEKEALTCRVGI